METGLFIQNHSMKFFLESHTGDDERMPYIKANRYGIIKALFNNSLREEVYTATY